MTSAVVFQQTARWAGLLCLVVLLCACAQRTWADDHTIQQACHMDLEAARTAMRLRDQGKRQAELLQTLPPLTPESSRLLQQMYQIVEEVYAYPTLNQVIYPTYRFEYCARQLQHLPVPAQLAQIAPQLQACQNQFGNTVSAQAVACVRKAVAEAAQTTPSSP